MRDDVPAALELALAAGWNQTAADWHRLIDLEPEGCFSIDSGGQLAATATLLCYGRELAWLGMVLTHRDHQRRGYARALCEACIELASRRQVRCIKLDATDQGRPLYASLGFEDEQIIERWRGETVSASGAAPAIEFDPELDREAFGADRSRFLEALGRAPHREGSRARYFGPYVSRDPEGAAATAAGIVGSFAGPWFWDLFPTHPHAPALAQSLGFRPVRRLVRMFRGEQIQRNDNLVYAIGGFEAG